MTVLYAATFRGEGSPDGAVEIRGAIAIERTQNGWLPRRLGAHARSQITDDFMRQSASECAGIRLALRTAASVIELDVQDTRLAISETSVIPPSFYDVTSEGTLVAQVAGAADGRTMFTQGFSGLREILGTGSTVRFEGLGSGTERDLEIWLPYSDRVELRALRANAPVSPPSPEDGPRWIHYGSSISHGYRAVSTTGTWPAIAALETGSSLTSLAFSGSAMLDQYVARTIRDTPADAISIKVGINLVNADVMRMRAFSSAVHGFVDTIRDGHPKTPLLVISPIFCEPVEDVAGPTVQDPSKDYEWSIAGGTAAEVAQGKLSLRSIRQELASIVAQRRPNDPAIHYLDGLALYGPADAERLPLPDNLHPGPEINALIGKRFAAHPFLRSISSRTEGRQERPEGPYTPVP